MSATYECTVYGETSQAEARKVAEEAVREEAEKVRKALGLDELAHRIASTLQAAIAGRNAAVAKAKATDARKLDEVADTLSKIRVSLADVDGAGLGLKKLADQVTKLAERYGTATRGPRRYV